MTLQEQLKQISTADLASELARRLAPPPPGLPTNSVTQSSPEGAPAEPRKRWPNKTVWASERAKELQATYDKLRDENVPDGPRASRKLEQMNGLWEEIQKFKRMAQHFARKGL